MSQNIFNFTLQNLSCMASWQTLKQSLCANPSFLVTNNDKNGIYIVKSKGVVLKYSYETDEWNEQNTMNQLSDYFVKRIEAVGVNSKHDKLYILNRNGSIKTLIKEQNDEKFKWKSGTNSMGMAVGSQGIMIKDVFHVIGGVNLTENPIKSKHFIFDNETEKMELLHQFDFEVAFHQLAKVKDKILLFGVEVILLIVGWIIFMNIKLIKKYGNCYQNQCR